MTAGRCWGLEREQDAPTGELSYLPGWRYTDPRTLKRMLEGVRRGGRVLASYGVPSMLTPITPELFGVEVQYPVDLAGQVRFGDRVLPVPRYQRLVVRPVHGEVLAEFSDGSPAAVWNRVGDGHTLLVTFPLERLYLEASVDPEADAAFRAFFALLMERLDPDPAVQVIGEAVSVQVLNGDGRRVVIVTNHLPRPQTVELRLRPSVSRMKAITAVDPRAGSAGWALDLESNGYAILETGER